MARKVTCDRVECGREISPFLMHPEVVIVNPPTPYAAIYADLQFCSWGCLMKYATNRYGKEVTGNAG